MYFSGARKGSSESLSGTRITTFMIYLSDVPLGGRTIFPQAGISVKPEAGSALYWYSFHRHIHFKKAVQIGLDARTLTLTIVLWAGLN